VPAKDVRSYAFGRVVPKKEVGVKPPTHAANPQAQAAPGLATRSLATRVPTTQTDEFIEAQRVHIETLTANEANCKEERDILRSQNVEKNAGIDKATAALAGAAAEITKKKSELKSCSYSKLLLPDIVTSVYCESHTAAK
jgi:hypothetical protein